MCLLLGLPVGGVHVESLPSPLGRSPSVDFHSPARLALQRGEHCSRDEVDRLSVVLMAGIAAEALSCGAADGGAADQRAVAELLATHCPHVPADEQARWAAANAVLLLRAHPEAYTALCHQLSRRASVGECCSAVEAAVAASRHGRPRLVLGRDKVEM